MKVAVITLHRVYNYGSALQAYATQRVLERMGHQVSIIDYITPQRTKRRILLAPSPEGVRGIKNILYRAARIGSLALKERTFGRFVEENLHLTKRYITAEDLERDPPEADIYVTGSDQTWNSTYNEGVDRGFFLDFLPETARRAAFAASFGKTELAAAEIAQTKRYIERYQGLSVREDSARHILEGLGRRDAVRLIDPTLQLTKEEWLELASPRLIEEHHAAEYARRIADEKGLKLVKLSWELRKPGLVDKLMTHRTPSDFLSLFHYADFVVTNSFHATAFSIDLEKQFLVVPRSEFNSRIESLLRLTGLENRLAVDDRQALSAAGWEIDYAPVRSVLRSEREKAEAFIRSYIRQ